MKRLPPITIALVLLTAFSLSARDRAIYDTSAIHHPVVAQNGMVSSQEELATRAGLDVLREGGNAVDAAVTVAFTLAVTLPRAGNIGGGGFMVVHLADTKTTLAIDYREKAPMAATRDMFLNEKGKVDERRVRFSRLASGVPGTVAGLVTVLEKYGTITLERALGPAIRLAEEGFVVTEDLSNSLEFARKQLMANPTSGRKYFHYDGTPLQPGERFIQKDLARTLRLIAEKGRDGFYRGETAKKIAADMKQNGGIITLEDLEKYEPKIRKPVRGTYRGHEIYSMPPPSSGGAHLVQILNILKKFPLRRLGHNTAETIHLMAEAMKFAYADRFRFMGDADFVEVPLEQITDPAYGRKLARLIDRKRALPGDTVLEKSGPVMDESRETTHFSVVDRHGNAVANTYTLNFSYGSGITVPGTGILMNNQMDDFTARVGAANVYGLAGGEPNVIEPEKRMLSSMSPTIVLKKGKVFLVTGSPGGSRIITTTLQIIMNVIDHGMNIAEATHAPRIHHQWLPDRLEVEKNLNRDTRKLLKKKGHKLEVSDAMGSTQSVMAVDAILYGCSDPRKTGALTLGY